MYAEFEEWLDHLLKREVFQGIVAFNFNIYECDDDEYDIQLIGADRYSESDSDWACDSIYSSEDDVFTINAEDWSKALAVCIELVRAYLDTSKLAKVLMQGIAVTVGFVDGDLESIYMVKD